jgi:ubiquinone/menaquinone biosynthesis C-methylase UbiE
MSNRRFAGEIERLRLPERVARLEVERVVALCLDGITAQSALDIGTGSGLFAEAFVARGLAVAGVDVNPAMLEAVQIYVPQGQFCEGVMEALPYPDLAFDLAFMGLVLHKADDFVKALSEARRMSKARVAVLEWPYREEFGQVETVVDYAQQAGFGQIETLPLTHVVLFRLTL